MKTETIPPRKTQSKDTELGGQMRAVFLSFYSHPKTMLQVATETGVRRANICWYLRKWRDENRIFLVKIGLCPVSKHRAGFYTTNKEIISSGEPDRK